MTEGWDKGRIQSREVKEKFNGYFVGNMQDLFYVFGMIQDSPGQGDTRIRWYIEYPYQKNFVRKAPLTVQGYQVVPKEQLCVSGWDIL